MIAWIGAQERDLSTALDMTAVGDLESVHASEEVDHLIHVEDVKSCMAD